MIKMKIERETIFSFSDLVVVWHNNHFYFPAKFLE